MPGENVYERLGVRRIINASSWRTNVGGSLMPPPVRRAMDEAAQWFVDLAELNARAGETIARLTGAEAGLVTAGSAAGMLLEAAACMTRDDPAKVDRLPDTTGMKNEIVIHRFQRVTYDRCFRAAGAKLVEIGDSGGAFEWELEAAINERTAAVAYIFAMPQSGSIPLTTGRRDRALARCARHSRRRCHAAPSREPDSLRRHGRRHGQLQRWQGRAGTAVDRHPLRTSGPHSRPRP